MTIKKNKLRKRDAIKNMATQNKITDKASKRAGDTAKF